VPHGPEGEFFLRSNPDDHFQAQVKPHLPAAYRTAALILLDRDLARDAVQEALIRAYRSRDRLRPGAPFWPWLHRLVVNEALRLAGRRRRQPLLLGEWPDLPGGARGLKQPCWPGRPETESGRR